MKYKLLGRSGLRVSELCIGGGTFGTNWGPIGSDLETSKQIFAEFVNAGGNFVDTSNRYQEGQSEEFVAELIASDRDWFVLGSKYTLVDKYARLNNPNEFGNHRKNLMRSIEGSLKRLKTDYIDLLWVHIWDYMTPMDEILRGLDDLVRSGKVHYIGVSNVPAWEISRANTIADFRGWNPFIAMQIEYNLVERSAERELMPMAYALDMAIVAWSPLSGGMTTGKYNKDASESDGIRNQHAFDAEQHPFWQAYMERNKRIMEGVVKVAEEIGRPPVQIALNWLRQQPVVTIPIFSARTVEQVKENLGCLEWELTPEEWQKVDEATTEALTTNLVRWGYPYDFLEYGSPAIPDFVVKVMTYGETIDQIENHRGFLRGNRLCRSGRDNVPGRDKLPL